MKAGAAVVLGLLLAPSAALGGDFEPAPQFGSDPNPTEGADPSPRKVAVAAFDDIPLAAIPDAFEEADRPKRLAGDPPSELTISASSPREWKRWLSSHRSTHVEIKPRNEGFETLSWVLASNANAGGGKSLAATCEKGGKVDGFRWESFRVDGEGKAVLEIRDGWFDEESCSLSVARRTTVRPKELASEHGMPLLFAVRGDRSITLMFPPGGTVAAADMADAAQKATGAVERITLPIQRGSSASMAATLPEAPVASWLAAAAGKAAPPDAANGEILVGVDAAQAVGEKSPTILVHTQGVTVSRLAIKKLSRKRLMPLAQRTVVVLH